LFEHPEAKRIQTRRFHRIARQSTWQGRVNQDGKGSRGIWIMPLMIVAGKRYVEG
jgi:hypothetical protein